MKHIILILLLVGSLGCIGHSEDITDDDIPPMLHSICGKMLEESDELYMVRIFEHDEVCELSSVAPISTYILSCRYYGRDNTNRKVGSYYLLYPGDLTEDQLDYIKTYRVGCK